MNNSAIITPTNKMVVSHQTNLGVSTYDLDELYSPDTGIWRSKVLDLGSPKFPPQIATAPTRYWFDRSRYQNHGTITGAVWKQLPSGIWVLTFDGTDDIINCGDGTSLDLTTAMTLEAWVYIGKVTGSYQFILGRDDSTNRNYFLQQYQTGMTGGFWSSNVAKSVTANTVLIAGKWYHFLVTYDKVSLQIYTNGALDCTPLVETGNIDNDDVSFTLGARAVEIDRDFQGRIGEARVHNRALTTQEIRLNYLATKWRYRSDG